MTAVRVTDNLESEYLESGYNGIQVPNIASRLDEAVADE
jgi:hypothetical protein